MGYAHYENHAGRPCGYGVEATCDEPGCEEEIDRGMAFLCGTQDAIHGSGPGCGGYFCAKHLWAAGKTIDGQWASACKACLDCEIDRQYFDPDKEDES